MASNFVSYLVCSHLIAFVLLTGEAQSYAVTRTVTTGSSMISSSNNMIQKIGLRVAYPPTCNFFLAGTLCSRNNLQRSHSHLFAAPSNREPASTPSSSSNHESTTHNNVANSRLHSFRRELVDGARYYLDGFAVGLLFQMPSLLMSKLRGEASWKMLARQGWVGAKLFGDVSGIYFISRLLFNSIASLILMVLDKKKKNRKHDRIALFNSSLAAAVAGAFYGHRVMIQVQRRAIFVQALSFAFVRYVLNRYLEPWSKRVLSTQDGDYDQPDDDLLELAKQQGIAVVNEDGEMLSTSDIFKLLVEKQGQSEDK